MISATKSGGLKLVDLKKKDAAMKIQWIKRIRKNETLSELAYYFLPGLGDKLWECNLKCTDMKHFMTKHSFWHDVLYAWCQYNYQPSEKIEDIEIIMNSIIWLNSDIVVSGKPMLNKKCIARDILYVKDFIGNNNKIMTFEEFRDKYGNVLNFLEYYGIVTAIPQYMKQIIQNNNFEDDIIETKYLEFIYEDLDSKYFYNESIISQSVLEKITAKWEAIIELPLSTKEMSTILMNVKVITLSTKLRSFYYRLLVHSTITNVQLYKWKMIDSDKCTFCDLAQENIIHLFWDCPTAKHIWGQVTKWYNSKTNQNVVLSCRKILLGKVSTKAFHCINTIVLITMQYIYASRCLKVIPNFTQLKSNILDMHNIEKYIATKNDKLKKHEIKWQSF